MTLPLTDIVSWKNYHALFEGRAMSGRIRSIKPEILEDEKVATLSDAEFRAFVGLIVLADDYGNFRADPNYLSGAIFWGCRRPTASSSKEMSEISAALEEADLVTFYEARGQRYGHLNGWSKHQKVDHPGRPRVPGIDDPTSWSRDERRTYFIRVGDDGPIKIGRASDVRARLAKLQCSSPKRLILMGSAAGGHREREFHVRFKELKVSGEWFRPDASLLAAIEECLREDSREAPARTLAPDLRSGSGPPTSDQDPDQDRIVLGAVNSSKPAEPALLDFAVRDPGGGGRWAWRQAAADELQAAFPHLDVPGEARKAKAWLESSPARHKTPRGMPRFLFGWMSRASDSGKGMKRTPSAAPVGKEPPSLTELTERMLRGEPLNG